MARNSFNLIVLSLLICACSSIIGTYKWSGNRISPDSFKITLTKDSTFVHYGWSDILGEDTAKGHWKLREDTLYLFRNKKDEKSRITLLEKYNRRLSNNLLRILDSNDSTTLVGAEVFINEDSVGIVLDTIDIYYKNAIREIKVCFLGCDSITVDNTSLNIYEIYFDLKSNKLNYFYVNPRWIKKGNKLIQIDEEGNLVKNGIFKK